MFAFHPQVNLNGHLSFETELPVYQANLVLPSGYQIIAAFLADIDTRGTGSVYYRYVYLLKLLIILAILYNNTFVIGIIMSHQWR